MMDRKTLLVLVAFLGTLSLFWACKPDNEGPDGDADVDSDVDGDIDGDGDADTDADSDADGDADADSDADTDYDGYVCDEAAFDISLLTPDMLIVLDRSYSMGREGYWVPTLEALHMVTESLDLLIWFGLMIFPNTEDPNACIGTTDQCTAPRAPVVNCASGNAEAIRTTLDDTLPCGGTPIAMSLEAGGRYLRDLTPTTGHPPYIVLATDGAPNCNGGLDGTTCTCTAPTGGCDPNIYNCLDDARTFSVIDSLHEAGIRVFVIGINTSAWVETLNSMAARGGTGSAIMADDLETIVGALTEVTGAAASCEFELGSPDPSADPDLVNFYFDGEPVPLDDDGTCDNGWSWVDEAHTRVRFCGTYCEQLRSHTVAEVRATYGCPTII